MEEKTKASVRFELSFLDGMLNDFIKLHKLDEKAAINLKSIVDSRVDTIMHIIDPSEPHSSIKKFDRDIWGELRHGK